jgi:hypothetical protein
MKSRTIGRIVTRFDEISDAGCVLDGDRLRRVRDLPLLHMVKLADALEAEKVGVSAVRLIAIVEAALVSASEN